MPNRIVNIVILLVVIVVLFVLGFGFGMMYQKQNGGTPNQAPSGLLRDLTNNVITSIVGYGEITAIDGRSITISNQGGTVTAEVNEDAQVLIFNKPAEQPQVGTAQQLPKRTLSDFSALKVGDVVTVDVNVSEDGKLRIASVVIVSPLVK